MPPAGSPKIIRVAGQLLGAVGSDEEVVLDPQAAAAFPVRARLDREHHSFLDRAGAGLMRIRWLVCTRTDTVRDGMRRLTWVAGLRKSVADQDVELGEARAGTAVIERASVDVEQNVEQLFVERVELSRAH